MKTALSHFHTQDSFCAARDNKASFTGSLRRRIQAMALLLAMASSWQLGPGLQAATLTWDTVTGDGGTITGGSGTWTNGLGNWNTGSGDTTWNSATPDSAIFGGTAGSVTLGGAVTVGNMVFNSAYNLFGGGNTLTLSNSTITVNTSATINSAIGGSTGLTKDGTGSLLLGGTNTYTGTTTISAGTLNTGPSGTLGTGDIVNNGALVLGAFTGPTLSQVISGTGKINITAGTVTLSGINTYTGVTTVAGGTNLLVSNIGDGGVAGNLGAASNAASNIVLVSNSGLNYVGTGSVTNTDRLFSVGLTGGILASQGTGAINFTNTGSMGFNGFSGVRTLTLTGTNTGNNSLAATIGDNGGATSLTKTGASKWLLTGTNTYTGTTTITSGILQIGNGGTSGTLGTGGVTNNSSLVINRSDTVTLANAISGTGTLTQAGTGTTILTGANSYSGSTTISAGVLQIGDGGTTGTLGTNTVNDNANLSFNRSDAITVSNSINGSGGVSQIGTGTTTLTAVDSYMGVTTVSAGTLSISIFNGGGTSSNIGAASNAAANIVLNGGTLKYTGAVINTDRLFSVGTSGGALDSSGSGALNLTNTGSMGFNGQSGARTLTLTGTYTGGNTLAAVIGDNGGATALTKAGAGAWTLSGSNSYTGVTTINGGVLNVTTLANGGSNSNIGASSNAASNLVLNGGTLQYNNVTTTSTDRLFSVGAAGGTISLPVAGTLNFTNTGSLGFNGQSGARTVTFAFSDSIFGGIIVMGSGISDNGGATSVVKSNTLGTVRLTSDNNTYTGTTTINGSLSIGTFGGSTGSIGTGEIIINSGGTLFVTRSGSVNLAQVISGAGGVTSNGNTMLTLSGTNTYTGVTRIISNGGIVTVSDLENGGVASSIGASSSASGNLLITTFGTLRYVGTGASTDRLFSVTGGASAVGTIDASGTGALVFTNTGAMGFAASTGTRLLILSGTNSQNNTMNPVIGDNSGATALTKSGAGTWVVAGSNSYTGVTTVSAGVLTVSTLANGGSNSNIGASTNAATNVVLNGGTLQYTGAVVSSDRLFSVGTSGGALDASGTGAVNFTNTGSMGFNSQTGTRTLTLTGTNTGANTLAAVISDNSGATSLSKTGAGTWVLTGANNYTGSTTISAGVLQIGNGGTSGALGSGSVVNNGSLVINRSDALTISGTISGSGGFTQAGTGTTTFTSFTNSYTGATLISAGQLTGTTGMANLTGSAFTISSGATLNMNGFNWSIGSLSGSGTVQGGGTAGSPFLNTGFDNTSTTFSGTIQDAGAVSMGYEKWGTGTQTLTGLNTYTNATEIRGGVLSVATLANGGSSSNIGASSNAAANLELFGGTLQYTGAAVSTDRLFMVSTAGGTIDASGLGAVNFTSTGVMGTFSTGARTLTLTGTNTDNNTIAAIISNNGGATALTKTGVGTWVLAGTSNTYSGVTTISGGVLSVSNLANGGGISNIGVSSNAATNLVLNGGTLQFTGTAKSTDRLFSVGIAGATLDASGSGAISFTNTGSLDFNGQSGARTLTLTGNNANDNTLAAAIGDNGGATSVTKTGNGVWVLSGGSTYTGATTVSGATVLKITSLANGGSASSIGASTNNSSNLVINGGTLTYTGGAVSTDRLFSIGTSGATLNVFGTGAVTFTNTGSMGFNGQSGTRTLTLANSNGGTSTIAAIIGDNGGATSVTHSIVVSTWALTGANTYTGATTINGGVLSVNSLANGGSASSIGSATNVAANLILNGGTLQFTGAGATTDRLFGVGASGGTLDASGTGAVNFTNAGSMGFNSQTGTRTLTLTGTNTGSNTLAAAIGDNSGATALTKSGAGTWVLTGANNYTGTTAITGGVLQVGSGGTTGTLGSGAVVDNAALVINRSDAVTFANTISGTGTFTQAGAGTTTFAGTKSYTGATFVNAGKLQAGGTNAFSAVSAVTVASGAVLEINGFTNAIGVLAGSGTVQNGTATGATLNAGGAASTSFDGVIQNGGSAFLAFNKNGTGTLTLSGSNTYTGGTIISTGVLSIGTLANGGAASNIGASTNAASSLILTGGTLSYTGAAVSTDRLFSVTTVGGTLDASGTGAVNFTNTGSMGFNFQSGARTLTLTGTNTGANTLATVIGDNGGATTLVKTGAGTWVLAGANTYSGTTTISAGVMQVGSGGTTGVLGSGSVTNNASLVVNRSDAITIANAISGSGSLTQAGAGTTTLTGTNSYGSTTISAGTLQVGNGGTTGSLGSGAITNNGTLIINRSDAITISGSISGTGDFIQNGTGTTTLSGTNQWNSATVNAGILAAGTTSSLGSLSAMTVNAAGTLVISGLGSSAAVGSLSGSGIVKNGGATASTIAVGSLLNTTTTFSGTIIDGGTGTMSLDKGGTGYTLILTGASTYTGPTRIFAGTMSVSNLADGGSASSIGASNSAATNLVFKTSSAVFKYTGVAVSTNRLFSVAGGGTLDASGTGALNLTNTGAMGFDSSSGARALTLSGTNTDNNTLAAVIGDNGGATSLTKSGVGTWLLTGANTYTGNTLILAGILQVGNGGISGSLGSGAVTNNASLVVNRADAVTVANPISGVGSFTQAGSGTTALTGANTYTGKTIVNSGVLSVASLANGGSASNLGASTNNAANLALNGGTLQYTGGAASTDRLFSVGTSGGTLDASGTGAVNFTNIGSMGFNSQSGTRTLTLTGINTGANTLAAVIGDNGGGTSLTKSGTGTWVLTGTNTYTGTTIISAGVLQVGSGGTSGSLGTGAVTNNASLVINRSDAITLSNTISGSGSFTQAGSGTTTLTGASSYTGSTILNAGVLSVASIANGGTSSNLGSSTNAATNLVLNGGALQYTGAAASTDRLFSVGTNGGTIDASGTGAVNFTNTGSMGFNSQSGTRTLTLAGSNTGSNTLAAGMGDSGGATSLVKSGAGTWVLTGTNTYTGTTTISAGVLQIGSGSTTGSLGSGAVTNNGSLVVNRSNDLTIANTLSGSGSFAQAGTGTTTLSGTNSYTGATTINSGVLNVTLIANGGSSSNIGAASNAAGNLVINGGTLQYSGAANGSTDRLFSVGIGSAVIEVTGTGTLNFTNTGSMGFNGQSGDRNLLLTGTNTGVNTIAAAIGDFGGVTSVTIDGAGTWLLTGANTYTGATTVSSGVLKIGGSSLDSAIILGSHATLELNGLNTRIGSLAGSGIVQNNSATAAALTTGGNNTSTAFSGIIQDGGAGALSWVKTGSGTFTLTGANTYTGTTTISAGTLQIGSGGTTGTLGTGAVTNNASLIINRSDAITVANVISGSGSLTQAGFGTTTLTGTNTYTGSTTINAGVLSVAVLADGGSSSNLGASTNDATNLVLNGGTLQYTGVATSTNRLFSVGTNGGTLDASGTGAVNFTNTGAMGFNSQSGIRTLTLTGTNTGSNTLAAVISDNGGATALTKSGDGTWVLTGANSFSGITTINAGVLQVGKGGTTGSLGSGAVTDNGNLTLNRSDAITIANTISGTGSLTQAGAGTTTLTGDNGFTGSTILNAGALIVTVLADGGSSSNIGASTNAATNLVLNGGSLQYTGADVSTDRLFSVGTNGGTLDASGTGAVNFTNSGAMGFNSQSGTRTLTLTGSNTGSNILAAVIGDNGEATTLVKSGAGTWVLTGNNTYSGTTTISAGGLQIGTGGTTGALGTGDVINNGSLTFNRSDAVTVANAISGSGSLTQTGSGTMTLSGTNSYSGSTTINAGVLSVAVLANGGASSNLGASTHVATNLVINGGTLQYTGGAVSTDRLFSVGTNGGTLDASGTGAVNFTNTGSMGFNGQSGTRTLTLTGANTGGNTLAAVIADNGGATSLTKSGAGTWVLSAANTYTGSTSVNAGTLQIGDGGTTGSLSTSSALSTDGTLVFNRSNAVTQGTDFASVISGSGAVTQAGSGTLTLNGSNTYAGATNISAGTLTVTSNNALGTNAAGTTVSSGATLLLNNVNYSTAEALTLNGSGVANGGALRNSGTSTYTGVITAATNASINSGGGILNLTGGLVKDGTVLTITGGGTVNVSGTGISGASANSDLVVDGINLVISADSNDNGPTTVQNNASLVANAAVTTTQFELSSNSTLAGTGAITTALNQDILINGTMMVGDPAVAPVATSFALTTSGTGAVVLGAGSQIQLDLIHGAGLGSNLSDATAADSINLHGKIDATAGGTVVIGNPNGMTNFHGGDQWQLVHLNAGDANAGGFISTLALNDISLHLASGVTSFLDQSNGVFSIIDTNGGLAAAAVGGQALISGGNTVTSDLNGHLFNLRSGGGEEDSISASLDEGVIVGEGDGDPKKASPIARRVARSRQWEVFATVNYGNVKLNPIRTQSGVQVDSWASGAGVERHLSRGLTLGFAASFLQSSQGYTGNAGSLHLEGPALSAYVSYVRGSFWNSLLYSFGTYQMDSIRNPGTPFPTAFGSTRTFTHSVQYNTGWNFRFQNNTFVTGPFVGVDYLHGTVDAYSEVGGGLAALHYSAQSFQSLVSRVGWSASKQMKTRFATITPQLRLSYERQNIRNNNGTSVSLINVPFSSVGGNQSPGQDYLVAGLGVNLAFTDRFSLMLSYQGQFFRHDLQAHFGSVRFSYQF
jgi:fibronectin-binding autotransporter adhesin